MSNQDHRRLSVALPHAESAVHRDAIPPGGSDRLLAVWEGALAAGNPEIEATRQLAVQLAGSKDCAKVYQIDGTAKSGGSGRDLGTLSLRRRMHSEIRKDHRYNAPVPTATAPAAMANSVYSAGAGFCQCLAVI